VIAAEKELVAVIEPEESRLQALQDAWDAAREAERQAKIRAEQERVEAIQKRIAEIHKAPACVADASSEALRRSLAELQAIVIGEDFAEFVPVAIAAQAEAIDTTEKLIAYAEQREAAEAQRAASHAS
jgi:acetolactate synthase small subunit